MPKTLKEYTLDIAMSVIQKNSLKKIYTLEKLRQTLMIKILKNDLW